MRRQPTGRLRRPDRASGFTLIELMVALVVLTLGLFPVIQLAFVSARGHGYARERAGAVLMAQAVAEELRTRAVLWTLLPGVSGNTAAFDEVFTGDHVILGWNNQAPAAGTELKYTNMHALRMFNNEYLATADGISAARLTNIQGKTCPGQGDDTAAECVGAIYRVHYIAYGVPLDPATPANIDPNLVRVIVIVSWDNKDHGDKDFSWGAWADEENFWRRQMVVVSLFLARSRPW